MESASEAQATMAGEEASCDPPPPAPAPPASSSAAASTKRRWSPSTWRYAIEDSQAELPSRPRAPAPLSAAAAPPSSRALHSSPSQPPIKAKPPYYNPVYGKASEEPHRSCYASRTHTLVETHVRSSPSQLPAKSRTGEVYRKSHHHLHSSKARACEDEEEEEDEEAEQDDHDGDDDEGLPMYDEEYFRRRRREMSPSELYFCTICSAKAAETKGTMCPYDNS